MLTWQDEYKSASGSVIAADFYHSNALMPLSDEAIIARVQRNLEICEPAFLGAQVCADSALRLVKSKCSIWYALQLPNNIGCWSSL